MIFTRICGRFALSFKTDVEYNNLKVEDQKENHSEKLPSNRQGGRSYESRASSCRRFQVIPAFRFEPLVAKAVYPRQSLWAAGSHGFPEHFRSADASDKMPGFKPFRPVLGTACTGECFVGECQFLSEPIQQRCG